MNEDLERKIRERAHQLWQADGQPEGRADEHWHEARRQVMADEGLGEPGTDQSAQPAAAMPEPQPEIPVDPLRNPEQAEPSRDAIYPTGPGPEMPGDADPAPEIPYESGISEIPAPQPDDPAREPAAAATATPAEGARKRGGRATAAGKATKAASEGVAKPRSGRSGRAKTGEVTT